MKLFWHNIVEGLKFQIKYSWYSFKRWPIIIVLYLIFIGLIGVIEPISVNIQESIVSKVSFSANMFSIQTSVLAYFCVSVLMVFQGYSSPIVQKIIGMRVASWIIGKIYQNAQSVSLDELNSANKQIQLDRANEAVTHISSGPAMLMYTVSYFVSLFIATIQLCRFPLLLMLYYSMGLIVAINNTYQSQKAEELKKEIEEDKRALRYYTKLLESKSTMIESRVHGYSEHFYQQWSDLTENFFKKQFELKKRQVKMSLLFSIVQQVIGIIPITLMYLLVAGREMDLATYTLVTGMGGVVVRYIGYIFNAFSKSSNCGIYVDEVENVLNYDIKEKRKLEFNEFTPIVNMENVCFEYVPNKPVLKNINFTINKNEIIAVVGENGSGKTTLSLMALGLYHPKSGRVFVSGKDIGTQEYDIRDVLSPVFQDYIKYEFTLRENVGYGNIENISCDSDITAALETSGFSNIYSTREMSLDTFLGKQYETNGEELSGGEWQRVAISRGIFGNSKLIILDEPTASLDPLSELKLFEHIKNSIGSRSAMIISHRIGICKLADRIVFIKNGEIVESGTHSELYAQKGDYYNFFEEQAKWYQWGESNEKSNA